MLYNGSKNRVRISLMKVDMNRCAVLWFLSTLVIINVSSALLRLIHSMHDKHRNLQYSAREEFHLDGGKKILFLDIWILYSILKFTEIKMKLLARLNNPRDSRTKNQSSQRKNRDHVIFFGWQILNRYIHFLSKVTKRLSEKKSYSFLLFLRFSKDTSAPQFLRKIVSF